MVFSWILSVIRPFGIAFSHLFKYRFTVKYPYEAVKPSDRYRGRPLLDIEKCVGCGVCANICPNKAIVMVDVNGRKLPKFDAGRCMFCGFCADFCPRAALTMTGDYELAEYRRENLIYPPERLSKPKIVERKFVTVKKLSKRLGVKHG
jgi:NADH-quinone oxidoreductase chain I